MTKYPAYHDQTKEHVVSKYPTCYTVETVLGCNLRCPICAVGSGKLTRKTRFMSLEQYQDIAKKIRPHANMVLLHNWGEPMLNPAIYDMIELTQEFARPNIHTNGQPRINYERLAKSEADIVVSVDAVTQETYEIYRRGGKVERALNTLLELSAYRTGMKTTATLHGQFLLFKHNQHELRPFIQMMRELEIPCRVKMPQTDMNPVLEPCTLEGFPPRLSATLESMKNCWHLDHDTVILVDGSVVPCCYDYNGEVVFGNIFTQFPDALEHIWDGPAYVEFREKIKTDPPSFCREKCLDPGRSHNYIITEPT